ncbi:MAG: hypothetical protein P4L53_04775 [Candidatus Obscuribacterales bacterium]|nr:hypothetical protein [Candidatus Obscuribacterales bacterium]
MTQLCFSRNFLLALACAIACLAAGFGLQSFVVAASFAFGTGWFGALHHHSDLKLWWRK